MKIVLVMDQFDENTNGTTVSARRFAKGLEDRGHDVRIVTTGKEGKNRYIVPAKEHGIVAFFCKKQGMILGKPNKKVLKEAFEGADVIHFLMPFSLARKGKKIADSMNIPSTTAFHVQPENITHNIGMKRLEFLSDAIYYGFRDIFYKKFTEIHCPSNFIAGELKNHGYKSNIHVISNGVSDVFVPKETEKKDMFKDKFTILMIGRYSPEKRQDVLINAIAKSKYNDKIQLVLAGKGPDELKYKKLANEKLANKALFGFFKQEDLLQIIRMSDLYVHSAEIEIEAISCIEAFACGVVPVISNSKKSATKQFAIDDRSLFKVNDSDDLAKKIDYFIEHPEERKALGEKYAEKANEYRLSQSIIKIEEMFKDGIKNYNKK